MKILFILFLLSSTITCNAKEKNDFALKVGGYYTVSNISGIKISNEPPVGGGISSHVGYRFENWEFNFSSYVNFAKFKDVRISVNESSIHGDGTFQSVTFGPTVRYYDLNRQTPIGTPYYALGGHIVMQNFKFGLNNVEVDGGRFNGENNLNCEGWGSLAALGLDKSVGKNKKNNYFIELVYIANRSRKHSEVQTGGGEIRLIRSENSTRSLFEQSFFLGVGLTLF